MGMRPNRVAPHPAKALGRRREKRQVVVMTAPSIISKHASTNIEDGPVFRVMFPVRGIVENAILFVESQDREAADAAIKLSEAKTSYEFQTSINKGANKLAAPFSVEAGTRMEITLKGKFDGLWLSVSFVASPTNKEVVEADV